MTSDNNRNHPLSGITPASLGFSVPALPQIKIPVNPNLASEFYQRLTEWIANFDKELDQEHDVGVRLVCFGQAVTFHLEGLGVLEPIVNFFFWREPRW